MDNQDVAILVRINELAERWGLKPYEFSADIEWRDRSKPFQISLEYGIGPPEEGKKQAFHQMLATLGIKGADWSLDGTMSEIIDALDASLSLAPRARPRT